MRYGPAIAAALLAVGLYAVTLRGTYIYDDQWLALLDPRLHDAGGWKAYLTQAYFPDGVDHLYRPVTSLSFWAEWRLHGDRPWIMHLVNLVLHAAVCAGVAELARRLFDIRAAWGAGLLYAAHPLHVEAVANIAGRAELFCTLFFLGAILLYLSPRRISWQRATAILALTLLAVGSKEQGILLPAILGAAAALRLRRPVDPNDLREKTVLRTLAIAICFTLAAYLVIRENSPLKFSWDPKLLDWTIQPLMRARGVDRWLLPLAILGRYTSLLILPVRLTIDYGYRVIDFHQSLADPYLYLGAATALAWTIALLVALRRRRSGAIAWCLLASAIAYSIVSNFHMLIGTTMAERLTYLPTVFLLILAGYALSRVGRAAYVPVLTTLLLLCSIRTVSYAQQWNNRVAFYQRQAAENPRSVAIELLLASEHLRNGNVQAALAPLERARNQAPDYWFPLIASARAAMREGRFDEADRFLNTAWQLKITMPTAVIQARKELTDVRRNWAASTQPASRPSTSAPHAD